MSEGGADGQGVLTQSKSSRDDVDLDLTRTARTRVLAAGALMLVTFISTFGLWTLGWALLAKQKAET
jgi:hypothetical protein